VTRHTHLLTFALLAGLTPVLRAQEGGMERVLPGAGLLAETVQAEARNKIDFSGAKAIPEQELRSAEAEEIREIIDKGVTAPRADDLAYYISTYYRKAGYSQVAVDYEIQGGKILIKINEGPRSVLHQLIFTGNHVVDEKTLYDYMIGATPERLAREPAKFPYTTDEISAGVDRVRGLYLSKGYLKVTIDASKAQLSKDGTQADVTVHITEGPVFTIGKITFSGDTLFPEPKLVAALGESTSGPFAPGIAETMERNLQSFYKAQGYYQAEVTATADSAVVTSGPVPIHFEISPKPLFRFGGISVHNQTDRPRLRPDFLPKRFAALHGQVYDPKKLDEAFREMLKTGLFDNLRVSLEPQPNNELLMNLSATEAKARELGFTIGAGTYEGVTGGLRLGDRDLFGNGRPLTFSADYSERGLRGEVLYVDPWFLDSRFSLRARLYSEDRQEYGYSKDDVGLRVDLTRKVFTHLELGVFGEVAKFSVTSTGIDHDLLGPTNYTRVTTGLTQNSDFRNDPLNPNRGFVFNSSFDVTEIQGAGTFTREIARFSYYLPIGRTMLAFGARGGYIDGNVNNIPIDSRFFLGGASTVRSFLERELGPKSHGYPMGGIAYTVFNIEYTVPITGALDAATFVDAGNLENKNDSEASKMRFGIGVGVRYKLPTGPVRLDFGINPDPNRRTDERLGAFNFSFGFAF
jgi:outer membrane protein assembly complex protein YaeT